MPLLASVINISKKGLINLTIERKIIWKKGLFEKGY
jgi:hypothetical protein